MPPTTTGLAITNPLILYRSLLATQKIRPDPAQHRLALHLQTLYESLIDYEPSVQYSQRLQQLSRVVDVSRKPTVPASIYLPLGEIGKRGVWSSLLAHKRKRDSLALTRVLTNYEEAMQLESPKGLMLHGEVGTGKSMLIDLFQECLPNRRKRRWHFNTFMLDTISRLEQLRQSGTLMQGSMTLREEHSLLLVARDLIETSPILFLDEFQLPDRAASKILSNLMTSFFQLGGVLIATSNRMPEELAKAAGMEFVQPTAKSGRFEWNVGGKSVRKDDGAGQKGEFAAFLEVLRARCEVWEMEGKKDYRKLEKEEGGATLTIANIDPTLTTLAGMHNVVSSVRNEAPTAEPNLSENILPKYYLLQPPTAEQLPTFAEKFNTIIERATSYSYPIPWKSSALIVYGRKLEIPAHYQGVAFFTFAELCGAVLGPADYITLASTYHTFILTDVPVMGFLQKNEARRLITLLDALYEARCRLLITAAAGPDAIFFPESLAQNSTTVTTDEGFQDSPTFDDAVYPETYSEIHQDLTSPFRPNISSYSINDTLAPDALEDDPPNRQRYPGSSFTDERSITPGSPNFANIGGLTGEDERFAVKRAESRIWEMCSGRWWARGVESEAPTNTQTEPQQLWWRPLPLALRHWEKSPSPSPSPSSACTTAKQSAPPPLPPNTKILSDMEQAADRQEELFPYGASPFRTDPNAPPQISWTHVWGTVKWGKRAGAWGKGVEGLEERKNKSEGAGEERDEGDEKKK